MPIVKQIFTRDEAPVVTARPPPLPPPENDAAAPENSVLLRQAQAREARTAEELEKMILADLKNMDGCPKAGVKVTVYGLEPWNSLLSFGVEAGPVRNKFELQTLCEIITERLKRLYVLTTEDE